jgi:hypothetical protein
MSSMKALSGSISVILLLFTGNPAVAQGLNGVPGASKYDPPLPPPPPSPSMAVPVVPKMGVPSPQNVPVTPRTSFHDRVSRCLDQGAAAGLSPTDRAAYSRNCANR